MSETTTEKAVRAHTALGVPPNTMSLIQVNTLDIRRISASTSSFFSVLSDGSTSGLTPDDRAGSSTSNNEEVDKTLNDMLKQISIMDKAEEKQKNISRDVKDGLKTLRSLLAVLQSARGEERSRFVQSDTPNGGGTRGIVQNRRQRPKKQRRKRLPKTPNFLRSRYSMTMGTPYNQYLKIAEISPKKTGKPWKAEKRKRKRKSAVPDRHRTQTARPLNNGVAWCLSCPKTARHSRTAVTSDNDLDYRGVTKTKDGAVLVRTRGDTGIQVHLSGRLREVLEDQGKVKDMIRKVTLEILDLDCLTETEEVQDPLNKVLPKQPKAETGYLRDR